MEKKRTVLKLYHCRKDWIVYWFNPKRNTVEKSGCCCYEDSVNTGDKSLVLSTAPQSNCDSEPRHQLFESYTPTVHSHTAHLVHTTVHFLYTQTTLHYYTSVHSNQFTFTSLYITCTVHTDHCKYVHTLSLLDSRKLGLSR